MLQVHSIKIETESLFERRDFWIIEISELRENAEKTLNVCFLIYIKEHNLAKTKEGIELCYKTHAHLWEKNALNSKDFSLLHKIKY